MKWHERDRLIKEIMHKRARWRKTDCFQNPKPEKYNKKRNTGSWNGYFSKESYKFDVQCFYIHERSIGH